MSTATIQHTAVPTLGRYWTIAGRNRHHLEGERAGIMSACAIRIQASYIEARARGFDHLANAFAELLRRELSK